MKPLKWHDWLVITSAILFIGCHLTTQFIAAKQADIIGNAEQAEALFNAMEAAPLFEAVHNIKVFNIIFTFLIVPSFILGTYVVIRRYHNLARPYVVENTALMFFFIATINFLNDFSYLLGMMAQ